MTASEITASEAPAETWKSMAGIGFSAYEASRDSVWQRGEDGKLVQVSGGFRSVDRVSGRRTLKGTLLSCRLSNRGYVLVTLTDDQGRKQTRTAQTLILPTFNDGPCPPGHESRHLNDDPLDNRWVPGDTREAVLAAGGNLMCGSKKQNTQDKADNGRPAVAPKTHPCVNHARCGGMVVNEGSRCLPCVQEVGAQAAGLLDRGFNLEAVTARLGYSNPEWVHKLAVRYGGYAESVAHAKAQRPPWTHRVAVTVRSIFGRDGS